MAWAAQASGQSWRIVRAERRRGDGDQSMKASLARQGSPLSAARTVFSKGCHRRVGVDIGQIYVYLRDEYAQCRDILTRELAALRADPPAPRLPAPFAAVPVRTSAAKNRRDQSIKASADATAAPAVCGASRRVRAPTLEHNMETLHWVRDILEKGGDWSRPRSEWPQGLRSFSVSDRSARRVYTLRRGITIRELIDDPAAACCRV